MKPDINLVEVHSQLSHNKHVVHGVLMFAGSLLAARDCVFCQCWAVLSFSKKEPVDKGNGGGFLRIIRIGV